MDAYRAPGGAPPPVQPSAPPVVVCGRCGVVAPARGSRCEVCAQPLAETRVEVPAPSPDTYWVAVRCGFTCNSCKFLAPLDSLDADGAVECAHCGLRQRFDVDEWRGALAFAHGVGDLAGPLPEGRNPHPVLWIGSENPHASVGETTTFAQRKGEGGVLSIDASPGHPVCRKCHVPLSVSAGNSGAGYDGAASGPIPRAGGAGAVSTACPRCGARASHAVPDAALALHAGLVAAVADEHRTDQQRAQPKPTVSGVVALGCPGCGAPLSLSGGDRVQTCAFCHVTCIVPLRMAAQAAQTTPRPAVWWILFRGASPRRRELEAPVEEAAQGVKAAINLLKPGAQTTPIGDAPGVYEAPEIGGIYWPQVALTLLLGSAAVAVGFGIYEAFAR